MFLRHYCVPLSGPDEHRGHRDFAGDRRAARGFNGNIAQHAHRWRVALDARDEAAGSVACRMARKSLLAVAGLVSVRDHTWTTDRQTGADRWGEIAPEHRAGLAQMSLWMSGVANLSAEDVRGVLDGTVAAIVSSFSELIGLWPDKTQS